MATECYAASIAVVSASGALHSIRWAYNDCKRIKLQYRHGVHCPTRTRQVHRRHHKTKDRNLKIILRFLDSKRRVERVALLAIKVQAARTPHSGSYRNPATAEAAFTRNTIDSSFSEPNGL